MSSGADSADNPLARTAQALPDGFAAAVSIGARLLGAVAAIYIAIDQSYDRTQLLAAGVAVISLASLAPIGGRARGWLSGFGASVVFFAGALLWNLEAGMLMVAAGAVAAIGSLADDYRSGRPIADGISAFFVGSGAIALAVAVILFAVEG